MRSNYMERSLTLLSTVALLFLIIYPSWMYGLIPDTIPTHFGASGKPDAWGSKASIFIMPGVGIAMYLLLAFLTFGGILENKAKANPTTMSLKMVSYTRLFLSWTNLLTLLLFSSLIYQSIEVTLGRAESLNNFIILIYMAGVVVPIPFLGYKSSQEKKFLQSGQPSK